MSSPDASLDSLLGLAGSGEEEQKGSVFLKNLFSQLVTTTRSSNGLPEGDEYTYVSLSVSAVPSYFLHGFPSFSWLNLLF